MDADFALALKLQEELNQEFLRDKLNNGYNTPKKKKSFMDIPSPSSKISVIDPSLEYSDPTPDIFKMFVNFDKRFFWRSLGSVEVQWSPRMTSCAGVCCYRSGNGATTIRLSLPLLKLRPRKDLVETLLHEMIHAYLFVTRNNKDRDGHGPEFQSHMHRINRSAGTNITIYHDFHAEVNVYKTHWWRCNGPCQYQKPFYGMVKRSMNRAPGPYDFWFADHQMKCGGTFVKVKEPENFKSKKNNSKLSQKGTEGNHQTPSKMKTMQDYFKQVNGKPQVAQLGTRTITKNGAYTNTKFGSSTNTKQDSSTDESTKVVGPFKGVVTMSNLKDREQGERGFQPTSPFKQSVVPFSGNGYIMGKTSASVADKPWLKRFDSTGPSVSSNKGLGKSVPNKSGIKQLDSSASSSNTKKNLWDSRKTSSSIPVSAEDSKRKKLGDSDGRNDCKDKPWLNRLDSTDPSSSSSKGLDKSVSNKSGIKQIDSPAPSTSTSSKKSLWNSRKTPSAMPMSTEDSKRQKIADSDGRKSCKDDSAVCTVACPICNKSVSASEINEHLDSCLSDSFEEDVILDSRCVACNQTLGRKCNVPALCNICEQGACSSDFDVLECQNDDSFIVCPMCDKKMTCGDLERHLEICIVSEDGHNQTRAFDEQDCITLD